MSSRSSTSAGVKATFFTLGWVAARHPALIRRIAEAGHEIASHGWDHQRVFTMDEAAFRADLDRAHKAIEDAAGQSPTGYRAPSFSIDARTPWAHPVLAERGYAYSSSVAPIRHDHYGWRDSPRFAWRPVAGADADRAAGDHGLARRPPLRRRGRGLLPAAALSLLELGDPPRQRRRGPARPSSISIRGRSIRTSRASRTRRRAPRSAITPIST